MVNCYFLVVVYLITLAEYFFNKKQTFLTYYLHAMCVVQLVLKRYHMYKLFTAWLFVYAEKFGCGTTERLWKSDLINAESVNL